MLAALLVGRLVTRISTELRGEPPVAAAQHGLSALDVRGKSISLPAPPRRIVSLAPATTEILFALGLKGRIVADSAYCNYPPEATRLPHIGDVNTSVEKVLSHRPDLVVGSWSANRRAIERIERARVPVFAVDPLNLAQTYITIRSIGRITGREAQAKVVVSRMQARVKAVTDAVRLQTQRNAIAKDGLRVPIRPRVLIVLQADPLWVAGSRNFVDELVTLAGGVNVAHDAGPGYHTYSPEKVVLLKPDVILVSKHDAERTRRRAGWAGLPAIRRGAVYSPDPNRMNRPGPRLPEALEEIAFLLHPAMRRSVR